MYKKSLFFNGKTVYDYVYNNTKVKNIVFGYFLFPSEKFYGQLNDAEINVYYSDIVETIKTAINAELKEELSKYTNLEVSDVQVQAVYEGSIEVVFTVVLSFLELVGGLKDLYDAVKLIREIAGKHIAMKLKNEYGDYFIVNMDAVSPDIYDHRYAGKFTVEKSEMDESSKRDAFFYYLLIANIALILIIGVLVFGAVRKVYF